MKKLLVILVWLVYWPAMTVFAHDFEVDGIYYNVLSDTEKTVEVTYKGAGSPYYYYSGSLMIPERVSYNDTNYLVIRIGSAAFLGSSSLISVSIPKTVKSIERQAFYGCN